MSYLISVNGRPHRVQAEPDTPLICVLRDKLELNGPQFGCGLEQRGSGMILVGAKAIQSCKLPVGAHTDAGSLKGVLEKAAALAVKRGEQALYLSPMPVPRLSIAAAGRAV